MHIKIENNTSIIYIEESNKPTRKPNICLCRDFVSIDCTKVDINVLRYIVNKHTESFREDRIVLQDSTMFIK